MHSIQISHQIPLLNLENLENTKKSLCGVRSNVVGCGRWCGVGDKGDGV